MKRGMMSSLAVATLMFGVTTALAATNPPETIRMSTSQRKTAWNDMNKQAPDQNAGSFVPELGAILPSDIKIEPVPHKAVSSIPALAPYNFAMVQHKLVIVNPSNKVIAYVVKE
jgi:hypothetical protein